MSLSHWYDYTNVKLSRWNCANYVDTRQNIVSYLRFTLRYRDEDPIVEKPGAVIIANYASVK